MLLDIVRNARIAREKTFLANFKYLLLGVVGYRNLDKYCFMKYMHNKSFLALSFKHSHFTSWTELEFEII